MGVVAGVNRNNDEAHQPDSRIRYLQTDLHTNPGSSGGPIISRDGRVVGMVTTRAEVEGISFAIQLDSVQGMIDALKSRKRIFRPWIGLKGIALNPELIMQVSDPRRRALLEKIKQGVLVTKVHPNGPAHEARLLPGDIITRVNDKSVACLGDILLHADPNKPDLRVEARRLLAQDSLDLNITLTAKEFDILFTDHQ